MRVIILFVSALSLFGCQKKEPVKESLPRPVKTYVVEDPKNLRSRPLPGVTRAEDRVNLSFRVDGPLIELPVVVGDEVKKGDLLSRIDPRDFEVDIQIKEAELNKAQATLSFATSDYARAKRIQEGDPGAISESLVDKKREEENRLKAEVKRIEAELEGAQDQLYYTYLRAPFDGIVTAKYVGNFEYVQAKENILRLLDRDRLEMVVDIPERFIPLVPKVTKSTVTIDSFPGHLFDAQVKGIGTEASATTRTYPVTLVMKQPYDFKVLAGMSGEVRFSGDFQKYLQNLLISIPVASVFTDQATEESFVWVVNPETSEVERRKVVLGKMTPTDVEVQSGLKPGDIVVTAGVQSLSEGQKVEKIRQ